MALAGNHSGKLVHAVSNVWASVSVRPMCTLYLLACYVIQVHLGRADYDLQVELQSFSNPQHRLATGDCCEGANTEPTCVELCDVAFVFCWKSYSSTSTSIDESGCFSRGSTIVYGNTDSINFPLGPLPSKNPQNPLNNPLTIAGDIWPVSYHK